MSPEPEMKEWRQAWSSEYRSSDGPDPREIIRAAARYQRRSHLTFAMNVAFATLLLAASLLIARQMRSREMVLWAICVWMTTLVASSLALERWRKSRVEDIEKVADYTAFHRKRALVDQWTVRTGVVFLVVLVLIASAWLATDVLRASIGLARFGTAMSVLLAISAIWVYVFVQTWKRSKAILETTSQDEQDAG